MLKFAANLTFLFTELPMLQRFQAAREAGFTGVEVLFPYDLAVAELSRAAIANGLDFVALNAPPPNWSGGPRGFAADPDQVDRFRRDFDRALRFAQSLRVRHIHIMAGKGEGTDAQQTMIENLRWATARAPHASLLIEPQNPTDMPGYFLNDFDQAARIIAAVGARNLGLQFDAYHAHRITGDVFEAWRAHGKLAHHIQIAGAEGRHEPMGGAIDYPQFFAMLEQGGYRGWIGAEYTPASLTKAGLGWLPRT